MYTRSSVLVRIWK